ncbi:5667_t:CDS:2, partial [Scutellospora calospora]
LASNSHTSSSDRNDTTLLDTYQLEEIYSQYIIQIAEKGYTVIDHLFEVYRIPDIYEFTCADALSLIPIVQFVDYKELKGFTEKVIELVGEPYLKFINISLPKSRFSLQLLGLAKERHIKRPAISSVNKGFKNFDDYLVQPKENYSVIWLRTFSEEKLAEEKFKPIDNDDALVKGANLAIAEYEWLQIGRIEKKFINFQVQSVKEYPIYKVKSKEKFKKWRLYKRLPKALTTSHQFPELPGEYINVKEIEDALDAFSDFLSEEPSTTLIRSTMGTEKNKTLRKILASLAQSSANLPCTIWVSYHKTLSNKSEAKLKELEKFDFRIGQYQNIVVDLKMHK